jgi:hypothetical protein
MHPHLLPLMCFQEVSYCFVHKISLLGSVVFILFSIFSPSLKLFIYMFLIPKGDIRVSFEAPLTDGGSAVQSYTVEWDTDPGVQEVQSIST